MRAICNRLLLGGASVLLPLLLASTAAAQGRYDNDAYQPPDESYPQSDSYRDEGPARHSPSRTARSDDSYRGGDNGYGDGRRDSFSGGNGGYGDSYSPSPRGGHQDEPGYPEPLPPQQSRTYEQNEIVAAGHGFFGAVSKGLASAVEYAFKSQGRPNGYILGEDASGAFVVGLRYGEGKLFTKDAGVHKVYWQGPSLGYDMGAEGSKTMVLVYNLRDPGDIYERFGGAEGSAYLVGGVSVQFQTYGHVTLGVIRSGIGVRLGANIGYSKYSRSPTWNPL